jgi:hypothetical protein
MACAVCSSAPLSGAAPFLKGLMFEKDEVIEIALHRGEIS